jgi:hypothetical protein
MQAALQRPAEGAAPSQLKMAEEQQPSPFAVQQPYFGHDRAPSLSYLYLYFTSTFSTLAAIPTAIANLHLHSHFPRSRPDAAPSANHLCMASSKGKEAFRSLVERQTCHLRLSNIKIS